MIPQLQLTTYGLTVLAALPTPNLPGDSKNFQAELPATDDSNKGDFRYDHYLTRKITLFERYSYSDYDQLAAPNSIPGPSGQGAGITSWVLNWQTAKGITWVISPTSIFEFRIHAGTQTLDLQLKIAISNRQLTARRRSVGALRRSDLAAETSAGIVRLVFPPLSMKGYLRQHRRTVELRTRNS